RGFMVSATLGSKSASSVLPAIRFATGDTQALPDAVTEGSEVQPEFSATCPSAPKRVTSICATSKRKPSTNTTHVPAGSLNFETPPGLSPPDAATAFWNAKLEASSQGRYTARSEADTASWSALVCT